MTRPANIDAIGRGTARSWEDWLDFLEEIGARDLSHKEIARRVKDTGDASGWWAQGIAVAYEQHIGRRVPGQDHAGSFTATATKTVPGDLDEVFARWCDAMAGRGEIAGAALAADPTTSITDKRRYWKCGLADDSRVIVGLELKAPGRVLVAVSHEKLENADAIASARAFWKAELAAFASG